jgi:glycerophosphoryl diester phosphodiesterase
MTNLQPNHSSMIVAAHRGYKSIYPENTLLAFQKALELGVDMLEFDLHLSKDHIVMVIHDETVNRTTNGVGNVSSYSLAELKQLDAGGWFAKEYEDRRIPTLEELCELLKAFPGILLNVEIKKSINARKTADQAIAMLDQYSYLDRCVFTCFDADIIAYIYDTYQLKTQGFLEESMYNFVPGADGTLSKMWAVGISMNLLTPECVKEIQSKGLQAWCYCPDTEEQVNYALSCGVTLMTVNDPLPALKICQKIVKHE